MTQNNSLHTDISSMNVSWQLEDLELFENYFNILESMVCTIAIFIIFVIAIIVHRAFYKLMKRLPGRDINRVLFPYMVKLEAKSLHISRTVKIFMKQKLRFGLVWGLLTLLKKIFRVIEGIFSCFHWQKKIKNFLKNIVAAALKSCIK